MNPSVLLTIQEHSALRHSNSYRQTSTSRMRFSTSIINRFNLDSSDNSDVIQILPFIFRRKPQWVLIINGGEGGQTLA